MTIPVFDGEAIELRISDRFHSGGLVAALDGSLLTWSLGTATSGRIAVYGSSHTRDIDTVAHVAGIATTLNLNIKSKPTYAIDIDQLAGGNVIVSWIEPLLPGSNSYFRIYASDGRALTPKTELMGLNNPEFMSAEITALANGGFCSTWSDFLNGSGESFVQVFSADGVAVAPAARINPTRAGDQGPLGVTDLGGDEFLILYSDRQDTGEQAVMGRVFNTLGVATSKAFVIGAVVPETYLTDIQGTQLANGNIVLTWNVNSAPGDVPDSVCARIIDAEGKPVGAEIVIATASGLDHDEFGLVDIVVVALQDGRWMVAWADQQRDSLTFERSSQLFGRIYNADGTVDVDTFDVDRRPDYISAVHMDVLADGRVAVRYETGYVNEVPRSFVQIIDPRPDAVLLTGSALGDQFQGTLFDDTIDGGLGRDKIAGMAGHDVLGGGANTDSLSGGDGDDTLNGNADFDLLVGGKGSDLLTGGLGNDVLTGGLGRDSFVFGTGADLDQVTDFDSGQDKLVLTAYHFATVAEALIHVTQTFEGARFAFGTDAVLLVGVDVAALGAGSLVL